jgi:hypothetical protein
VVVNYVYRLVKPLEEYQKVILQYSVMRSRMIGKVFFHCNKEFIPVITELNLDIDALFMLEDNPKIDYFTFWAASKIEVYNKRPCGEIHLDIDSILKDTNLILDKTVDVTVAYYDKLETKPTIFELPFEYNLPFYIVPETDGFNMSFVIFNNKELKDRYCEECFRYMENNNISDKTWKSMVWVEQSFLTQIVKNFDYTYKYLTDTNNDSYYHLGAHKHFLSAEDKEKLINKIKIKNKNESHNKILH